MRRALFLCLFVSSTLPASAAQTLSVAAAASFTDVLPKLVAAYRDEVGGQSAAEIKPTFDATSRLAKQIEQGAPFDVLISADVEWIDDLQKKKKIDPASRQDIASNALVVVVPKTQATFPMTLKALGDAPPRKLALAGENVPAGRYAEAALKTAGVWDAVKPRIVRADHVRAALKWVAVGEANAAIVYFSDLYAEDRVKLAIGIDATLHPRIRYLAAITTDSKRKDEAKRFVAFLSGGAAQRVFVSAGFARP